MRSRVRFVVALTVCVALATGAVTLSPDSGAVPVTPVWAGGHSPLARTVYAQSVPAPQLAPEQEPAADPEPAEAASEPDPAEQAEPEPERAPEPEPDPVEPEPVVEQQPEPEPAPEPLTLAEVYADLQTAITAEAANRVTVGASSDAFKAARQALVEAEMAHAAAMEDQGEHNASIRAAAQAFVDFLTATYLTLAVQ